MARKTRIRTRRRKVKRRARVVYLHPGAAGVWWEGAPHTWDPICPDEARP